MDIKNPTKTRYLVNSVWSKFGPNVYTCPITQDIENLKRTRPITTTTPTEFFHLLNARWREKSEYMKKTIFLGEKEKNNIKI